MNWVTHFYLGNKTMQTKEWFVIIDWLKSHWSPVPQQKAYHYQQPWHWPAQPALLDWIHLTCEYLMPARSQKNSQFRQCQNKTNLKFHIAKSILKGRKFEDKLTITLYANLDNIFHANEHPGTLSNQTTNFISKINQMRTLSGVAVPYSSSSISAPRKKLVRPWRKGNPLNRLSLMKPCGN